MLVSHGIKKDSQLIIMEFDLENCEFKDEVIKRDGTQINSEYFAEGVTAINDKTALQLTSTNLELFSW